MPTRWVGVVGRGPLLCCPAWQSSDPIGGENGVALDNYGIVYTAGFGFLEWYNFPAWTYIDGVAVDDISFPTWEYEPSNPEFSGGITATGVDNYLYAWVSNDVNVGQLRVCRFDPDDLTSASVLSDLGATPSEFSFFRTTSLTWHPATPGYLWGVFIRINPDDLGPGFPAPYTQGDAYLVKIGIDTGNVDYVQDLTEITTVGGAYYAFGVGHQLQQWDRGVTFLLASNINEVPSIFVAFDVLTETFDTHFYTTSNLVGYGVIPGGGEGYGLVIGRTGEPTGALTPLSIGIGGTLTETVSECQFVSESMFEGYGYPLWWFAPPDRSAQYVTEFGQYWRLDPNCENETLGTYSINIDTQLIDAFDWQILDLVAATGVSSPTDPGITVLASTFIDLPFGVSVVSATATLITDGPDVNTELYCMPSDEGIFGPGVVVGYGVNGASIGAKTTDPAGLTLFIAVDTDGVLGTTVTEGSITVIWGTG